MNDNGCPCTPCCVPKVEQFDKVINYPNKFQSYNKLDSIIRAIVEDRGNKFRYRVTVSSENTTNIACHLPSGLIISGISFFNPEDDQTDLKTGLKIAAGRLEGSLKYLTTLLVPSKRFAFEGSYTQAYLEQQRIEIYGSAPAPAQRAPFSN